MLMPPCFSARLSSASAGVFYYQQQHQKAFVEAWTGWFTRRGCESKNKNYLWAFGFPCERRRSTDSDWQLFLRPRCYAKHKRSHMWGPARLIKNLKGGDKSSRWEITTRRTDTMTEKRWNWSFTLNCSICPLLFSALFAAPPSCVVLPHVSWQVLQFWFLQENHWRCAWSFCLCDFTSATTMQTEIHVFSKSFFLDWPVWDSINF